MSMRLEDDARIPHAPIFLSLAPCLLPFIPQGDDILYVNSAFEDKNSVRRWRKTKEESSKEEERVRAEKERKREKERKMAWPLLVVVWGGREGERERERDVCAVCCHSDIPVSRDIG